jgi:hypothetical protein
MVGPRSGEGGFCHITSVINSPFYLRNFPGMLNASHHSGAGYTFGSGVVYKFLETNGMTHILRAHQLCMEGYASLFDNHLSTVWSAPNYCYRCGNSASILEVSPGGKMYFNVFEAAPENERDGPTQQAAQSAGGKVSLSSLPPCLGPIDYESLIPLLLRASCQNIFCSNYYIWPSRPDDDFAQREVLVSVKRGCVSPTNANTRALVRHHKI